MTYYPGDYVRFVAKTGDAVRFHCSSNMEKTLYGKIFRVVSVDETEGSLKIERCSMTEHPEECALHWNFSPEMFTLYEEPPSEDSCVSGLTFDDFLNEVRDA